MMEFLAFTFDNFWNFLGMLIFFGGLSSLIYNLYSRVFDYLTIRKHGYPPEHCNASGKSHWTEITTSDDDDDEDK